MAAEPASPGTSLEGTLRRPSSVIVCALPSTTWHEPLGNPEMAITRAVIGGAWASCEPRAAVSSAGLRAAQSGVWETPKPGAASLGFVNL